MKHIVWSALSVIAVLIGFRIVSPAASAAPSAVYHIAYLVDRNADFEDEMLRPKNLFKNWPHNIEIAYSWGELLRIQAKKPLDALVIHDSALPMIDFEWVANAYWHGITISTANIQPGMIAHLYDDACLPFGGDIAVPEEGGYMTISTLSVMSLHDENQAAKWFRRDWRRDCHLPKPAEVTKPTCVPARYTSGPIMDSETLQFFLIDHLDSTRQARKEFKEANKELASLEAS